MMNRGFDEGYEFFSQNVGAQLAAMVESGRVRDLNAEIAKLQGEIAALGTNKTIETLSGDIAEFFHADTFNMDAILNGSRTRAEVPRVHSFGSADVLLKNGGKVLDQYQIKYWADGAKSAKAQAVSLQEAAAKPSTNVGAAKRIAEEGSALTDPVYKGMKRLVADDQLLDSEAFLTRKISEEAAKRPEQVGRYDDARGNLTSVVKDKDGVSSKRLTRDESKHLARESKDGSLDLGDHGLSADQLMEAKHIAKASLKAGLSAAAIAALLQAAPSIIASIEELQREGEIDIERIKDDGRDVLSTGSAAFVTGALTAAITDMMQSGKLGEQFINANSAIIASATVIAVNAFRGAISLAKGETSGKEYADSILRDTFVSCCALTAGMLGQSACPIPAVGYMLGSFIGSVVGGVGYEAGKKVFVSFAVESGATFFGLVDQNYELPDELLEKIGIDVFHYDEFELLEPAIDFHEPDVPDLGLVEIQSPTISFPSRGVIAVGRVGYIY